MTSGKSWPSSGTLRKLPFLQAVEEWRQLAGPADVDDDRPAALVRFALRKQDELQVAVADVEQEVDEVGRLDVSEEVAVLKDARGDDRGLVPRLRAHSAAASRIALTSLGSSAGATAA